VKYLKLTDEQIETIKLALRSDYKNVEALQALPIGAELRGDIESAHAAVEAGSEYVLDGMDAEAIARTTVAKARGGMRVVIGDRTPRHYDKADQMAGYIKSAVLSSLAEMGLYDPEAEDANAG
jgi:hypothetical protein